MLRSKVVKVEQVNDKGELDFLNTGFEDFKYKGKTYPYTLTTGDVGRPDMVSVNVYGDEKYWWFLMKYNKICDVWNDLRAGVIIKCPPKTEIEKWYVTASRRKDIRG